VNGAIRIGALQVSKLKMAKLNAKIAIAGGRLDVSPLTLNLYEGAASGNLSLNAAGNSVAMKQNLAGVSINPLMKDLADKDLLEGRGNVALDVTSRGDSVAAMKKALAGTAAVSLKDGAIKGINLAQSLRDLKAKLGAKQDSTQQAKAGDKTDFSELTASLKIANGIAHNDDLAMKSPFLRLSGAGDIDIGGGQMNYVAKASVVGTSAGQGGKETDQLKGVTVPVRVSGPFDNLAYKIEFGSLVSEAAKAKVEEKKEEIKAKVEDKAKDKLKGLFGK
jgi:AsmA protein